MRVLVACEFSGIVRDAFIRRGHDAWSCDLLPSERTWNEYNRPAKHFQMDVIGLLTMQWDLMIAFPPCFWRGRLEGNVPLVKESTAARAYECAARWRESTACQSDGKWPESTRPLADARGRSGAHLSRNRRGNGAAMGLLRK